MRLEEEFVGALQLLAPIRVGTGAGTGLGSSDLLATVSSRGSRLPEVRFNPRPSSSATQSACSPRSYLWRFLLSLLALVASYNKSDECEAWGELGKIVEP